MSIKDFMKGKGKKLKDTKKESRLLILVK